MSIESQEINSGYFIKHLANKWNTELRKSKGAILYSEIMEIIEKKVILYKSRFIYRLSLKK